MAIYGLTDSGLLIKSYAVIVAELELAYRAEFGDDVNTTPPAADGIYIHIYAEREAALWELGGSVHDSAYPDAADGVNLDGAASLTGTERLAATFSTVTATVTGTPGSVGLAGRILEVEGSGERFTTNVDATIGAGGTIDVLCTAQNSGAVLANAGTLNIIVTPVSGWTSVINAADADLGEAIENDAELRLRRRNDIQNVGAATVNAIRANLINNVTGVTDAFVFENDTSFPDANGVPDKSIHTVVAGGADADIAAELFDLKSGGIQTAGIGVAGTLFSITSFASSGPGLVLVTTSAAHGFLENQICVIAGTTYDNGYYVKSPTSTTFLIEATFTATDTGTVQVPTADANEVVQDDSGTNHTIEFDRASAVDVWMHVQIGVGSDFVQGSKQQDVIEILTAADSENYTATVNGIDFTINSGVGATVDSIAAALIVAINSTAFAWVPATATASGPPDEFVNLESDYPGNEYTVTTSGTTPANLEVVGASHVDGSGDQAAVISNIIDFAEGTANIAKEQTIGHDVYLSRYFTPVNAVDDVQSISITATSLTQPITVPPGGGDWSTANIAIATTEIADLDTLKVTVEIV